MRYISKTPPLVCAVAIVTCLLVIFLTYSQVKEIEKLNIQWKNDTERYLTIATQLAQSERDFGYVGFIHHFKNFVIRKDPQYYQRAEQSYQEARASLLALKKQPLDKNDSAAIEIINNTLEEYHQKLIRIRDLDLSTTELDELVKVDDTPAEQALSLLRSNILPNLQAKQIEIRDSIERLQAKVFTIALLVIPLLIISTVITVRLLKQLADTSDELSSIFDTSPDAILYVEHDGRILRANKSAEMLFGYFPEEFKRLHIEDLVEDHFKEKHKALRDEFSEIEQSREMAERATTIKGVKKDGSTIDLRIGIATKEIHDVMRSVCIIKDVTEQQQLEEQASKDHLTSIDNRRAFDDVLIKELERNKREFKTLSLLMIDLDNFKQLNDQHGHTAGDEVLIAVAKYLHKHIRSYDHLARWGGDEFVILCPDLSADDALNHAKRINNSFTELSIPYEHSLTLSIGIASAKADKPVGATALIENADKALYAAKRNGRDQVRHYDLI